MLVCLSSGARPKYRNDIIRALALPEGARLQFRYDRDWIAASAVLTPGNRALIGYIDQSSPGTGLAVLPVRYAELVAVESHGLFRFLTLRIREYPDVASVDVVNRSLRNSSLHGHCYEGPQWADGDKLEGAHCFEVSEPILGLGIAATDPIGAWHALANSVAVHADFGDARTFVTIQAITDLAGDPVSTEGGDAVLSPETEYMVVLHWLVCANATYDNTTIAARNFGDTVTFTTAAAIPVDSRYDIRRLGFRTHAGALGHGVIAISVQSEDAVNYVVELSTVVSLGKG